MKFLIESEDQYYIENLERYYKKHYKSELDLKFNEEVSESYILITSKEYASKHCLEKSFTLSDKNQVMTREINQFQSARAFMNYLLSLREEDLQDEVTFQTFAFSNVVSSAGATTLSLNLAKKLSQKGQTIWLSLEEPPSTMFYTDQKSGLSMIDIMYYMKDEGSLKERLSSWLDSKETLHIVDQVEVYKDLSTVDSSFIDKMTDLFSKMAVSYVVIDFGNKVDLLLRSCITEKIMVLNHKLNHFYRLPCVLNTLKVKEQIYFAINKRQENIYLNEAYLRVVDSFFYIDFDNNLYEEERGWQSELIMGQLTKHLKL